MPTTTPGHGDERRAATPRPTPTPPGTPGAIGDDTLRGFSGGNLVGSWGSGLDEARGVAPGDGSLLDRDMPIGSDLARATSGSSTDAVPAAAGNTLSAGPGTLGANSGGERASAGTASGTRSSRDHGNTLESPDDGLE